MSSNETTKIEPTLIVPDAPPIVPSASPAEPQSAKPASELKPEGQIEALQEASQEAPQETAKETSTVTTREPSKEPSKETVNETVKSEAPAIATLAAEAPKPATPKIDLSTGDAPTLPKAARIDPVVAFKKPAPVSARATATAAPQPRSTRFALLAACVAIAASFGAVGGSLGIAKFGPMITSAPPAVAPIAREHVADEVKALKESVAQLRTATRTLSDSFSALKTTVASAGTQNSKIAETLERIEKSQAELRKSAALAAPETTGSIAQPKQAAVPMVLGDPPTTLKPPTVQGWVLRRVYDGAALIEGRDGIVEVEPGMITPGLGRVEAIKRQDGRWVVVTSRGLIIGR
jgi:hypothetical protein